MRGRDIVCTHSARLSCADSHFMRAPLPIDAVITEATLDIKNNSCSSDNFASGVKNKICP